MKVKNKEDVVQVMYNGKWVNKSHFRAFVYNAKEQKLANSWDEYESLIASGLWFSDKPSVSSEKRRSKHGSNS